MAIPQWWLTLNFDSGIESVKFNYGSNEHVFATSGEEYTVGYEPGSSVYLTATLKDGYTLDTVVNSQGNTVGTIDGNVVTIPEPESGFSYVWTMTSEQSGGGSTMKFKHLYDAGTIGTGTYKFRHYSQQEPSTGETWVLNETLTNQSYGTKDVTFNSNGATYSKFARYYKTDMLGEVEQDYVAFYTSDTAYITVYDNGTWTDQAYRTITFDEPVTDSTLLAWLQANGVKQ